MYIRHIVPASAVNIFIPVLCCYNMCFSLFTIYIICANWGECDKFHNNFHRIKTVDHIYHQHAPVNIKSCGHRISMPFIFFLRSLLNFAVLVICAYEHAYNSEGERSSGCKYIHTVCRN